jgi:hypothetical protein
MTNEQFDILVQLIERVVAHATTGADHPNDRPRWQAAHERYTDDLAYFRLAMVEEDA